MRSGLGYRHTDSEGTCWNVAHPAAFNDSANNLSRWGWANPNPLQETVKLLISEHWTPSGFEIVSARQLIGQVYW